MKRFYKAALLCAALIIPHNAFGQGANEHLSLEVLIEYAVTTPAGQQTADEFDVPMTGTIETMMYFPIPECITRQVGSTRTYATEQVLFRGFDREFEQSRQRPGGMIVSDNPGGNDQFWLTFFFDNVPFNNAEVESMFMRAPVLPGDVFDDLSFVTDATLLEEILNVTGVDTFLQLVTKTGSRALPFEINNVQVRVDRAVPPGPIVSGTCIQPK
ncbi:MAG: hypothetical protein AAFN94_03680 [Pseudomonadota bacterium]